MSSEKSSNHVVQSDGNRIVAEFNGDRVAGDWKAMKRLAKDILSETDNHKTTLQKIEEISGAWAHVKCDCCGYEEEFEYPSDVRERGETPKEHAEHPDFECDPEDVTLEAWCPRHGRIPLAYDECDDCASITAMMKR